MHLPSVQLRFLVYSMCGLWQLTIVDHVLDPLENNMISKGLALKQHDKLADTTTDGFDQQSIPPYMIFT
ncbi:hypothetical protein GA0061070_107211 [Kosakonia oryziphila]|uniref:Uncharacterized protein n=1 Tax=Kosakonia oryziphila TaxID=1005667 RepID=A0A1C4GIS1_9ENTR|nr:hypothetical protein GA0061070_107211 [Kosakonia oryziphila]